MPDNVFTWGQTYSTELQTIYERMGEHLGNPSLIPNRLGSGEEAAQRVESTYSSLGLILESAGSGRASSSSHIFAPEAEEVLRLYALRLQRDAMRVAIHQGSIDVRDLAGQQDSGPYDRFLKEGLTTMFAEGGLNDQPIETAALGHFQTAVAMGRDASPAGELADLRAELLKQEALETLNKLLDLRLAMIENRLG